VAAGPTTTSPDDADVAFAARIVEKPLLYVVLECDRPKARGARFGLADVDEVVIGRGATRAARREIEGGVRRLMLDLPGRFVSFRHARLRRNGREWFLEDAQSRNGSFVNGERIERRQLRQGDVIELGHKLLMLSLAEPMDAGSVVDLDIDTTAGERGITTLIPGLDGEFASLRRIAPTPLSVLLLGETGTGKELLAIALHKLSRRAGPLVPLNCGALTVTLAESQLFGHVRGAFSGAVRDEPGFLRRAQGGTLLLDEVGDLPELSQATLLRVLQDRKLVPVGSSQAQSVSVRFIASTHKDLRALVAAGRFRQDLLARLNGFAVRLPPLRERKADLGMLIGDLLSAHFDDRELTIAPDAGRALLGYDWPENIRELEQCLLRAGALTPRSVIREHDLPPEILLARTGLSAGALVERDVDLRSRLVQSLEEHGGNVSEVARSLGKARAQVHRWLKKYNLRAKEFRR
jgi:hypothetical protein